VAISGSRPVSVVPCTNLWLGRLGFLNVVFIIQETHHNVDCLILGEKLVLELLSFYRPAFNFQDFDIDSCIAS
jgi:hypothetical protein